MADDISSFREALEQGAPETLPPDLVPAGQALLSGRELLDTAIAKQLDALGDRGEALLIAALVSRRLWDEGSPGDGWAPIHAARLLNARKATRAIEPLLDAMAEAGPDSILRGTAAAALGAMGEAALEPTLARLSPDLLDTLDAHLVEVLSKLGVRDERVFEAVSRYFELQPELGAGFAANYGDDRLLPRISEELDVTEVEDDARGFGNQAVIELAAAIRDLGGTLSPSQQRKLDAVMEQRQVLQHLLEARSRPTSRTPVVRAEPKVGRNDPCPCGSGKKYKKCHGG